MCGRGRGKGVLYGVGMLLIGMAAGILISMIPIILIYIFAQKYFKHGIMAVGVKG